MNRENLLRWMRAATADQRQYVADAACNGSVNYLYQLASGHRSPSPEKAALIANAIALVNASYSDMPAVSRDDLTDFFQKLESLQPTG